MLANKPAQTETQMIRDIEVKPDGNHFKVVFTPMMGGKTPTPEITFFMDDLKTAQKLADALDDVMGIAYEAVAK